MFGSFSNHSAAFVGCVVAITAYFYCTAQESPQPQTRIAQEAQPPRPPTSHQLLMRDKLTHANKALEGLSMHDFGMIAEAGKTLGVISRAAAMNANPSQQYVRFSKNFQEQARDLERHAVERNIDAASMDYVRITLTCVQCHNYIRENRVKRD
jgi:hypothetical protein